MQNPGFFYGQHSLEDAFFIKRDAELIEQQRRIAKMHRSRAALSDVSGITNPEVLDKLLELEITPQTLASLAVVPLVEVAWADGHVDAREHKAVLDAAKLNGFEKGDPDYALLDNWLNHRPSDKLLHAWVHYIRGLCETLEPSEIRALQVELTGRARKVAEAAGGILGMALKVSPKENAVLKKMESAFVHRKK